MAMRWELLKSEIMYRCRIFSVRRDYSRSLLSGQTSDFHVLATSDWVNVPNPAIMNNRCHVFLARDVGRVGAPQWDGTEELAIETIPLDRVPRLIRDGSVGNALTLVAFHLLGLQDGGDRSVPRVRST
jgi:hypothetical protein